MHSTPGVGTRFRLDLPRVPTAERTGSARAPSELSGTLGQEPTGGTG